MQIRLTPLFLATAVFVALQASHADTREQNEHRLREAGREGDTQELLRLSTLPENEKPGLNSQDFVTGKTALHLASENGHTSFIAQIADLGADLHFSSQSISSPVIFAFLQLKKGPPESKFKAAASIYELIKHPRFDVNRDQPLIWAAGQGHVRLVERLLALKADINVQDALSRTALTLVSLSYQAFSGTHWDLNYNFDPNRLSVKMYLLATLDLLIEKGADLRFYPSVQMQTLIQSDLNNPSYREIIRGIRR